MFTRTIICGMDYRLLKHLMTCASCLRNTLTNGILIGFSEESLTKAKRPTKIQQNTKSLIGRSNGTGRNCLMKKPNDFVLQANGSLSTSLKMCLN